VSSARRLKAFFYFNLLIITLLISHKLYLDFFEQDFRAVHTQQVERIQKVASGRTSYDFAVIGNVNNSILVFERKIIPLLNSSGVDFVVSAGNAVSSGGADKYRAIYKTLNRLNMPYVLGMGANEISNFGSFRFYEHFGPYYFVFRAGNSVYFFIDSTGKTSLA
jgi:hypothetical protein